MFINFVLSVFLRQGGAQKRPGNEVESLFLKKEKFQLTCFWIGL